MLEIFDLHSLEFRKYREYCLIGFPGGSEVKASASNAGDPGSIPGLNAWVGKIP